MLAESTTLTKCGSADAQVLRQIGRQTYADTFSSMNTPENMTAYLDAAFSPERIKTELGLAGSAFYFLHVGVELAGYLKLNLPPAQSDLNEPESLEIERIYITPRYQGRGFGKRLLETAEEIGIQLECRATWLGVWEKNVNAIGFYARMGYAEIGRHSFRMGDEVQSDLIMKKLLVG